MTEKAGERPLRNRVDPTGDLIATAHRGTMYGNRGVLHDASHTVVRRSQVKRWLVCELSFRGRRRPIMTPGRYTELFFADEAVALAAGHRPCAECRHGDYQVFRALWTEVHGLPGPPRAEEIDEVLHTERGLRDGRRRTFRERADLVPDGVFVLWHGDPWLVTAGSMLAWAPPGYTEQRLLVEGEVSVLTPPSTVAVIRAGYRPRLHSSWNR